MDLYRSKSPFCGLFDGALLLQMGETMHLTSTPLVQMNPVAKENYRRLLVAATRVNPKGLLDPCYGYALQVVAGMIGYEDLPFGRGSMGRIAKAVLEIRTSEFLSTFVPLQFSSNTFTHFLQYLRKCV